MLAIGLLDILKSIPHLMLKQFGREIDYCNDRLNWGGGGITKSLCNNQFHTTPIFKWTRPY